MNYTHQVTGLFNHVIQMNGCNIVRTKFQYRTVGIIPIRLLLMCCTVISGCFIISANNKRCQ